MKKIKFGRMEDNLKFFYPMNKTEKESLGYIKKGGWGDRTFENTYFVYYSPRSNYRPTINFFLSEFETLSGAQSYAKRIFKSSETLKEEINCICKKLNETI
tara:strand:+ start:116 stop:418 length:303 start_codon:yes stop_codon:yes gene_type:complete